MKKHCEFPDLRVDLDNAITYGTLKAAAAIAKDGLRQAQNKGFPAEAEYFLAQQDIIKKRFTSAIEHLDKAIKGNPLDGAAYNDRALCMVELGIIDEAIGYFDKGIAAEPDYATVYHNKGWLLNNIGRHSEAIEYFRKALELEPKRPVTYDNLADALYNLGDSRGALMAYKKVLSLLKPRSCPGIRKEIAGKIQLLERELSS